MPPYIKKTFLNFFSFFLLAFSLYIFISLVSYDSSDSGFFSKNSSEIINNLGGPLGATVSDFLFTLFGYGSYYSYLLEVYGLYKHYFTRINTLQILKLL